MTNEEAFKIGFLMRCAEEGLVPESVAARIKQASLHKDANVLTSWVTGAGTAGAGIAKRFVGSLLNLGKLGLIAAPPLAGVAGGYTLAKATQDDFDTDEARKRELIAEYQQALDQLTRTSRIRGNAQ